jgi:hypothetical protein
VLDPALWQAPLHMHAQGTRFVGDYDAAAALFLDWLRDRLYARLTRDPVYLPTPTSPKETQ